MKIKQEFWELIKKNKKTIELRKVSKLGHYIDRSTSNSYLNSIYDGRYIIPVFNDDVSKKYGEIVINGYSIIKNPFKGSFLDFCGIKRNFWNLDDLVWIQEYFDWLVDYFKNEEEILILNIESYYNYG